MLVQQVAVSLVSRCTIYFLHVSSQGDPISLQQRALSSYVCLPYLAGILRKGTYIFKCFVDSLCDTPDVVVAVFLGVLWKTTITLSISMMDDCISISLPL